MGEPETWQELLGNIIADLQERRRIAEAIKVNPVTLMRWTTKETTPRPQRLIALLNAVPQYQEQLADLLQQDYPYLLNEVIQEKEKPLDIPSSFYTNVMGIYTTSPLILRTSSISTTILQQMLAQLDPQQSGLAVFIVKCMPSHSGTIRSLRTIMGRGNREWRQIEQHVQFQGIESQVGYAVQSQRPVIVRTREERESWYPVHTSNEKSAAALPICSANQIAGGIGLLSMQENYFTPERINIIQKYTDLLALAFEADEFYPQKQIELVVMPAFSQQQSLLSQFQHRVNQRIVQATRNLQFIPRQQAETEIWQKIEEDILQLTFQTDIS